MQVPEEVILYVLERLHKKVLDTYFNTLWKTSQRGSRDERTVAIVTNVARIGWIDKRTTPKVHVE